MFNLPIISTIVVPKVVESSSSSVITLIPATSAISEAFLSWCPSSRFGDGICKVEWYYVFKQYNQPNSWQFGQSKSWMDSLIIKKWYGFEFIWSQASKCTQKEIRSLNAFKNISTSIMKTNVNWVPSFIFWYKRAQLFKLMLVVALVWYS